MLRPSCTFVVLPDKYTLLRATQYTRHKVATVVLRDLTSCGVCSCWLTEIPCSTSTPKPVSFCGQARPGGGGIWLSNSARSVSKLGAACLIHLPCIRGLRGCCNGISGLPATAAGTRHFRQLLNTCSQESCPQEPFVVSLGCLMAHLRMTWSQRVSGACWWLPRLLPGHPALAPPSSAAGWPEVQPCRSVRMDAHAGMCSSAGGWPVVHRCRYGGVCRHVQ